MIGLGKSKTDHTNHGNRKNNELLHDFLHRLQSDGVVAVASGKVQRKIRVNLPKRAEPAQVLVFTRPFKAWRPAMSGGMPPGRIRSKEALTPHPPPFSPTRCDRDSSRARRA